MSKSFFTFLTVLVFALSVFAGEESERLDMPASGFDYAPSKEIPRNMDIVNWSNLPDAPANFGKAASGVLGNYMYIFGSRYYNLGLAFNLSTEQWEQSTPPPLFYHNWCGVATNDAIYTFCGSDSTLGRHNEVLRFTPTGGGPTGTWSLMAPYPVILTGVAAAWDGGNYLYATGGGAPGAVADAYKYDIVNDTWTQVASMPSADWFHGAVFVRDKLYCMKSNYNYEYDPVTDTWTSKAPIPQEITFGLFHLTNNDDYVISAGGGGHGAWPATNAVQLYHPQTDTWLQETVLPGSFGYASVQFAGNGTVISAGGVVNMAYTGITLKGTDFPGSGGPGTNLQVRLYTRNPPGTIPPTGGYLNFGVSVINQGISPITCDAWTEVILPNGVLFGPLMVRTGVTVPPGTTPPRAMRQWVPGAAPPGNYNFIANVGQFPDSVVDYDRFIFEKLAGEGAPAHQQGWACYGWGEEEAVSSRQSAVGMFAASPNPFNATTVVSYKLQAAGNVKLAVFDIAGREITKLVDGYKSAGTHRIVFDGKNLTSGVYFVKMQAGEFKETRKLLLVK